MVGQSETESAVTGHDDWMEHLHDLHASGDFVSGNSCESCFEAQGLTLMIQGCWVLHD